MAYSVTATYQKEAVKLSGTFPVDMYAINATPTGDTPDYRYYINNNYNVYGFQLNATGEVTSSEQLYTGLPIKREPIQSNLEGEIAGLSITVPNTDRVVEALIQNYNYLRGCDVHILSFFAKHLPSGAGADYIGETADHNAGMKEKYYIDTVSANEEAVTFTCKSKFNINKISIPGRKFTRECSWNFSATGDCSASATQTASWVTCNKTISDCRKRHNEARFGGYSSIPIQGR
jgi:lambda family phage minor tail protein L